MQAEVREALRNTYWVEQPAKPEWFDAELQSFDPRLYVVWAGRERPALGEFGHWNVFRRILVQERTWNERNGIYTLEPEMRRTDELVLEYVGEDEEYLPLDRRFFDVLAEMDPGRQGHTRWSGFQRMVEARAARRAARKAEMRERAAALADSTLQTASDMGWQNVVANRRATEAGKLVREENGDAKEESGEGGGSGQSGQGGRGGQSGG